eukprot:1158757-Pelagomonas_calceolata.AAC.2
MRKHPRKDGTYSQGFRCKSALHFGAYLLRGIWCFRALALQCTALQWFVFLPQNVYSVVYPTCMHPTCPCLTQPCLTWEPLLAPAITPHLSPASASHLPADFSTSAADMWLQLLLLAAAAVPVLQTALHEQQEQMANVKLMRIAAGEASEEEDPFGLGIGRYNKDEDDDVSISSVSSSDSDNSSSDASAASSSSGVSLPDQVFANRGPRAMRVGGVDARKVQAKKEEKAKRRAQEGEQNEVPGKFGAVTLQLHFGQSVLTKACC